MRRTILAAALLLSGCTSTAEIGQGRYTVSDSSYRGLVAARGSAVAEATDVCAGKGKKAVIESFDDHGLDAMLRSTSSVIFHCE